jgi:hypothetical protein
VTGDPASALADTEFLADLFGVEVLALEGEGGVAGDDEAVVETRELGRDPDNVRALTWLSAKFPYSVQRGLSVDPEGDLKRGNELASKALALDPNYARAHSLKAGILQRQLRVDESIAEYERALAHGTNAEVAGSTFASGVLSAAA